MSIYFCPRINTKIYIEGLEDEIKNILKIKWFQRLSNSVKNAAPVADCHPSQDQRVNSNIFYRVLIMHCIVLDRKIPGLL